MVGTYLESREGAEIRTVFNAHIGWSTPGAPVGVFGCLLHRRGRHVAKCVKSLAKTQLNNSNLSHCPMALTLKRDTQTPRKPACKRRLDSGRFVVRMMSAATPKPFSTAKFYGRACSLQRNIDAHAWLNDMLNSGNIFLAFSEFFG